MGETVRKPVIAGMKAKQARQQQQELQLWRHLRQVFQRKLTVTLLQNFTKINRKTGT